MYILDAQAIAPVIEDKKFVLPNNEPAIQIYCLEPSYSDLIPRKILRRMGKATRIGVGTALNLIERNNSNLDGIIIGTGLGGMEDCIKFLNQIVDYEEGTLTPTNFVQSTSNALAGSLGLMLSNTGYNMTHVGRGGAFESALGDALLSMETGDLNSVLLGSTEEISTYNFNIDKLEGQFREEEIQIDKLLKSNAKGTICGEGAAMFIVSTEKQNSKVKIDASFQLTSSDPEVIKEWMDHSFSKCDIKDVSHLILGKNGDNRTDYLYDTIMEKIDAEPIYFKDKVGEYPSVSSFAVYLAYRSILENKIPSIFNENDSENQVDKILIYNHYKGEEHSLILMSKV